MAITVGSVEVDITPNTRGIYTKLRDGLVPAATKAGQDAGRAAGNSFGPAMQGAIGNIGLSIGEQIGAQIANRIKNAVKDALKEGITIGGQQAKVAGAKQGEDTGGAFARTLRAKLTEAFRAMPKLDINLSDTGVDAELARLRARLETLSGKRIGVDVDVAAADAEVADISERLQRLGALHPNVAVRSDTAQARAALDDIREEIARVSAQRGTIHLETDGSFGIRLRAAVQAAQAALPNINIGADTSPAQAQLASLRAQLATLSDQRVGIDIDAATASAKIDEIRARLRLLGVTSSDISVRVDAATAEAQLAQVEALADAVDGKDINLHVSNAQAMSAIFQVAVAIGALAAIPAIPVLAAGTGSLVSAFTAAGVGVGAFAVAALPALSSIKGALDAQKQAQDAASNSTNKGAQAAAQAAQKSIQMAGAQQALASAERNGARQIAQAQQQVVQARRAAADAVQQAAQKLQQAERAVSDAEKNLTQSQKAAKQAQLDLTAARKTAAEQLQDLNNQQKDSQLALLRAQAQVRDAQNQVNADAKAGAKVTADQRSDDLLALAEAQQALVEQQITTKRLQDQTTEANKAGITGSSTYQQAQQQVAQAQQDVVDKTQALKDARTAEAQTEVDNAKSIADAQSKIADAERGVADAQASAADSITSAQRQIQSASLSSAGSVDASATAAQKYQQALAKLTPSARGTFNAFLGLRSAFKSWSVDLQPNIMPIFTRGINGAKNSLPGLTPLVLGAARGISTLQDKVSKGFKSPWWQTFKKDFAKSVEPAIVGVGTALGNVFVGSAGVIDAFLAHIDSISGRMDKATGRFANFGKNLRGSPAFENFLSYSAQEAPKLADALGKIGGAFIDVAKAVSPLSGTVLASIGLVAQVIGNIATSAPGALQLVYGLFVAMKLFALATKAAAVATAIYKAGVILATLFTEGWAAAILAADAAFDANPIVVVITIIVAAIALLVVAVIYAWGHFAWFRDSVLAVWHAIEFAALWAWNNVLKPTFNALAAAAVWLWNNGIKPAFNGIITAYHAVATAAIWLWQTVLAPVFSAIGAIISFWWNYIVKPYFALVKFAFLTWAALILFVYNQAVKPIFGLIGVVIAWWWNNIVRRYFNLVMAIIRTAGGVFSWLYSNVVKPVFGFIGDTIAWVWSHSIKPAFDALKTAVSAVADAFSIAQKGIGKAWDLIRDATKKPINFVLDTVWNKGIVGIWGKIGGWIPGLPKLHTLPLLEAGGTVPAAPGVFNRPTAIVGEGNPSHPEYVIPTDPKYRGRALNLLQQAGTQMLAGGGIIGTITGAAKSVGGAVVGGIKSAGDFLQDPVGNLVKLLDPVLKKLTPSFGSTAWGKLAGSIPSLAVGGLKKLIGLGGDGGGAVHGTIPKGQHAQIISQAMAAAHVPPPGTAGQWLAGMNTLIGRESGWNASAINNWDSNAKAGHPSQGLTQTIPGTWAHYVPASLKSRGILDPVGNVAASIRYIVSRYGNISKVQQANASLPPQGYDSGGYLQPGLNLAYNGTGRPEPVFTTDQANALMRLGSQPGPGASGRAPVTVNYNAPVPENPDKAAMEIGRRVNRTVAV